MVSFVVVYNYHASHLVYFLFFSCDGFQVGGDISLKWCGGDEIVWGLNIRLWSYYYLCSKNFFI